ncbi:MAG: glycosyltransferase family 2 protein [Candidatus Omnitrophica bacterium]|nr:glycosyltransferase family 2 protein [Candidatus Omnitrophota bacterium]
MQNNRVNLFIVVPVYNEEQNIIRLLSSIKNLQEKLSSSYDIETIVVDDGSRDSTVVGIEANKQGLKITLLKHISNKGPGASFATGFEYLSAKLKPVDWVVTMEGDNTSKSDILNHMLVRKEEGYDAVFASPYIYGGRVQHVPGLRIFTTHVLTLLIKIIMNIRGLTAFSYFFRLYNGRVILKLQERYGKRIVVSPGFEHALEILAKMVILNAKISEVDMTLSWAGKKGRSKMKFFRTIRGYLKIIFRFNYFRIKKEREYLKDAKS